MSLTTDAWSNPNLTSFLGVTAHYIVREAGNGHLLLKSGLLAFRHITGSHTGENLARILSEIIHEMGIIDRVCDTHLCPQTVNISSTSKIGSITADNAANNNTMMRHLEAWFRDANVPFDHDGNRVRYLKVYLL